VEAVTPGIAAAEIAAIVVTVVPAKMMAEVAVRVAMAAIAIAAIVIPETIEAVDMEATAARGSPPSAARLPREMGNPLPGRHHLDHGLIRTGSP
jgi:hypothetical protein